LTPFGHFVFFLLALTSVGALALLYARFVVP
jgi:hypothetical protein